MSYFNQRGVFLQLMQPGPSEPNTWVSMQLARKQLGWDAENETQTETLVDSIFVTAISRDNGNTFTLSGLKKDVDGDGDLDAADEDKLKALAKAYASIVNP